jgi:hypothetical protein
MPTTTAPAVSSATGVPRPGCVSSTPHSWPISPSPTGTGSSA